MQESVQIIHVFCFTNLDKWREVTWPHEMAARPMVGDYVEGVCGDKMPRLKIIAITHRWNKRLERAELCVELH